MLALALSALLAADDVTDWATAKVREHKAAVSAKPSLTDGGVALFRERPPVVPGFVPPTSLGPLVKAVRPGVVNVSTDNEGSTRSLGSGFVITPDGLVVTN